MNSKLRKAINVRNMLKRKYNKVPGADRCEKYRPHRNMVIKLREEGKRSYVREKSPDVKNGSNSGMLWSFWFLGGQREEIPVLYCRIKDLYSASRTLYVNNLMNTLHLQQKV